LFSRSLSIKLPKNKSYMMTKKNYLTIIVCFTLALAAARFIYSTTLQSDNLLFNPTYAEKSYDNYFVEKNEYAARSWGPIAIYMLSGLKKIALEDFSAFIWRLGLFISYGIIIYFFYKIISEFNLLSQQNNKDPTYFWNIILVFITLQSTAAIHNIVNGAGEIYSALCIVGHFYFFYKKKYSIASIYIVIGVYFKLQAIVFAFPYFIFAIFSSQHREYIKYILIFGVIFAIISYPIQGLRYGSLYPFSMIFSVVEQSPNTIPIWSQEIFNPTTLINKILYGFQIEKSYSSVAGKHTLPLITSVIISVFTLLFILSNALAGFVLSRFEYRWKSNDQLRFVHLFLFQVIIGFLFLVFSVDVAIVHLLVSVISIYAPIFLFSSTIHQFNDLDRLKIRFIIIYIIGLILVGGFIPISMIASIMPYDLIDKIVGVSTKNLGQYGKFIWYHFPLFGILIIAYVSYYYSKLYLKDII
jgi:hypothetical protein